MLISLRVGLVLHNFSVRYKLYHSAIQTIHTAVFTLIALPSTVVMSSSTSELVPYHPREILNRPSPGHYKNLNAKTLKDWIIKLSTPVSRGPPNFKKQNARIKYCLDIRNSIATYFPTSMNGTMEGSSLTRKWVTDIDDHKLLALAQIAAATNETRDSIIQSLKMYDFFEKDSPQKHDTVNTNCDDQNVCTSLHIAFQCFDSFIHFAYKIQLYLRLIPMLLMMRQMVSILDLLQEHRHPLPVVQTSRIYRPMIISPPLRPNHLPNLCHKSLNPH